MKTTRAKGSSATRDQTHWNPPGDELEMLEGLEDDLELKIGLIESEDFSGLVDYLEERVDRRPDDVYAIKDLGEAYVMNGEPDRAVELLKPLYHRVPHFEPLQWVILDALFDSGRDETWFEWHDQPPVVRFSNEIVDACCEHLASRGCPAELEELYCRFLCRGYCAFSEEDLLVALREDGRFVIDEEDLWVTIRLCRRRGVHRGARDRGFGDAQ